MYFGVSAPSPSATRASAWRYSVWIEVDHAFGPQMCGELIPGYKRPGLADEQFQDLQGRSCRRSRWPSRHSSSGRRARVQPSNSATTLPRSGAHCFISFSSLSAISGLSHGSSEKLATV